MKHEWIRAELPEGLRSDGPKLDQYRDHRMTPVVTLDEAEMRRAALVGCERHIESMFRSLTRPDHTIPQWGEDIEGAAAELAVAKALAVEWGGSVNAFCEADVGQYGVRHTERDRGCLILRKRDHERYGDDGAFILVTGRRGTYVLQGEMTVGEARKHPEWWKSPNGWGGAYFVPQAGLNPIS